MHFDNQTILPAVRDMKDFEALMTTNISYIVLLETHLAQLPGIIRFARKYRKRIILHIDLIQGLKHDEAAAQFLCQMVQPDGIISTHASVISTAKKHKVLAIQRFFLIDSHSLKTSYRVLQHSKPDYLEVLPGVMPDIIRQVKSNTLTPVLAGGFIRTREEIEAAVEAGATAITTSDRDLWECQVTPQHFI